MPNFSGIWTVTQQMQAKGASTWPQLPGAPTIGTATALGPTSASVPFTAPSCTGYPATITGYTATSTPGCFTSTGASSPLTVTGLTSGSTYTFKVKATNGTGTGPCSAASNSLTMPVPGSQSYTTPGTYTWVAPSCVSRISIVAVGAGGNGGNGGKGGGGGGLAYRNNVTVVPGGSYTVVVGTSTAGATACYAGTSSFNGTAPAATGGRNGQTGSNCLFGGYPCGSYTGGATGGRGSNQAYGGGGGAAGYTGDGGAAGTSGSTTGKAGSGGGAGGGVTGVGYCICGPRQGGGSGGGGVGIFGQGTSGASVNQNPYGSCTQPGGRGGSSGANGANGGENSNAEPCKGIGGAYGGGAGGGNSKRGAYGAVRIVWPGCSRTFPSTCVGAP